MSEEHDRNRPDEGQLSPFDPAREIHEEQSTEPTPSPSELIIIEEPTSQSSIERIRPTRDKRRIAIAKRILSDTTRKFISFQDTKELFYFNGELWVRAENYIAQRVRDCREFALDSSDADIREIISYIRDKACVDRAKFETNNPNLIPLSNGVYDINLGTIGPFKAEDHFFFKSPVKYDPNAKCPLINKFLDEVVNLNDKQTLIEWAGYCLYRSYILHKTLMLLGETHAGKSTYLYLLTKFIGDENCSHAVLQEIMNDRFAKADLYHKMANIAPDIPSKTITQTGTFKSLCGEDKLRAQFKFQNKFDFMNYAKMAFSGNTLPRSFDMTDAFFTRWLLIKFPNRFEGERADKFLKQKLTTLEELSGLLNLALDGLRKLLSKQAFTYEKSIAEAKEDYIRESDSVHWFAINELEIDLQSFIEKRTLYELYCIFCWNKLNRNPDDVQYFYRHLKTLMPFQEKRSLIKGDDGKYHKVRRLYGITLKPMPIQKAKPIIPNLSNEPFHTSDNVKPDENKIRTTIECSLCGYKAKSQEDLAAHKKAHHGNTIKQEGAKTKPKSEWPL